MLFRANPASKPMSSEDIPLSRLRPISDLHVAAADVILFLF
jgi:hypothetical protein